MCRCDHCYEECSDLRSLSRSQIHDPWDHLPINGSYCPRCYQRLSYHGIIHRVIDSDNGLKDSIDHIHHAVKIRQSFLWDISPFHEVHDLEPLITPYKDDLSSLLHIIINLFHFGYDRTTFNYIGDIVYDEWLAEDENQCVEVTDEKTYVDEDLIIFFKHLQQVNRQLYGWMLARLRPPESVLNQLDMISCKYYAIDDLINYLYNEDQLTIRKYCDQSLQIWKEYSNLDPEMNQLVPIVEMCCRSIYKECLDNETDSPIHDPLSQFWYDQCQYNPRSFF